jgi:hypothetical protein
MYLKMRISAWLQYLYFLRFPILAYLFLPLLVYLDGCTGAQKLTRGIVTVDSGWQAFFAAFFVVALGMTILITARNIVYNGAERFRSEPPAPLEHALTSCSQKTVWIVLAVAHIPTYVAFWYFGYIAAKEQERLNLFGSHTTEHTAFVWLYLSSGVAVAVAFWYLVALFYYWTYSKTGFRMASLIFPAELFGDISEAPHPPRVRSIESCAYFLLKLTSAGFAPRASGPFYELHFLSAVSLAGYMALYFFLYGLTAPRARPDQLHSAPIIAVLSLIAFLYVIANADTDPTVSRWSAPVKRAFQIIPTVCVAVFLYNELFKNPRNSLEMAFPAIASVVALATLGLWAITGLSFLLDRYRSPVIAVFLTLLIFPKIIGYSDGERYYEAVLPDQAVNLPSPAEVLKARSGRDRGPLIVVTASGGGIHAAAWTSQVVSQIEASFTTDPMLKSQKYSFHDHLLLASGVSGGSVGLMPFLLEYATDDSRAFHDFTYTTNAGGSLSHTPSQTVTSDFRSRVTNPPACSSLEAVAWGMEYYDLYRLLFDFIPAPQRFTPGTAPDRSWALTSAFQRNLTDPHCFENTNVPPADPHRDFLTLNKAANLAVSGVMPAFTFNTTAEESGGRFLLSNYQVPPLNNPTADFLPSESFLQAYAEDNPCRKPVLHADLPLATAARLSATFPYVTSGTRLPTKFNDHAYHFLDGGYFDNDGTASVIEFLKSALDPQPEPTGSATAFLCNSYTDKLPPPPQSPHKSEAQPPTKSVARPSIQRAAQLKKDSVPIAPAKIRILLIEIRDGDDVPAESDDDLPNQERYAKHPWTALTQLFAPPTGLWNAGHVNISRRNRRELCLLESTYRQQLNIHHIVFTIQTDTSQSQPLSWKLTSGQRQAIFDSVVGGGGNDTPRNIHAAIDWVGLVLKSQMYKPPLEDVKALEKADHDDVCNITKAGPAKKAENVQ